MKKTGGLWRLSRKYERTYAKLLHDVEPFGAEEKLTAFWPQIAPDFEPETGWLFVGQSVNGWGTKVGARFPAKVRSSVADVREFSEEVDEGTCSPLEWVAGASCRRAPFWNAVRWLNSDDEEMWGAGWHQKMAWSNVAKISPHAGGNPRGALIDAQANACRELLRLEIEEMKPAVVAVLAGPTWFRLVLPDDLRARVDVEISGPRRDVACVRLHGVPTILGPHPGTASRAGLGAAALEELVCRRLDEELSRG